MRQRFLGLALLVLSAPLLACSASSSTDSGTGSAGSANSAGDANLAAGTTAAGGPDASGASGAGRGGAAGSAASPGNSGTAGAVTATGGSASGDDTSACPVWPAQRVMPIIGPFFYGPDPGPCSSKDDLGISKYTYEGGLLQSELQTQHGVESTTTYSWDAPGRLMASSDGASSDSYEFGPDSLIDTTLRGGSVEQQVTYSLSPSGYPLSAVVSVSNQLSRTVTYSYKSCRLFQRTITAATGSLVEQDSYTYDSVGHVIARSSGTAQQTYDYSCW